MITTINLDSESTIYDNAIEMYFYEYFENRGISLQGLDYQKIDNSLFEGAFSYVYKKLFKPDNTTVRYNNKNTKINLRDIDELNNIADMYIDIIKGFNVTPFDNFFLKLTGIHKDTWNSWKREEYSHNGLSSLYSDLYEKIHDLPRQQVRNNVADKLPVALANNDPDVGLEYEKNNQINRVEAIRILTDAELPRLGSSNFVQIAQNGTDGATEKQDIAVDDE